MEDCKKQFIKRAQQTDDMDKIDWFRFIKELKSIQTPSEDDVKLLEGVELYIIQYNFKRIEYDNLKDELDKLEMAMDYCCHNIDKEMCKHNMYKKK
jgi:hypothetical protein